MYVSAADWFSSLNNNGLKQACSNPRDKPPQPAKRSIQYIIYLDFYTKVKSNQQLLCAGGSEDEGAVEKRRF
jgi:hypothetical protein